MNGHWNIRMSVVSVGCVGWLVVDDARCLMVP